jgi:hypothetical protein
MRLLEYDDDDINIYQSYSRSHSEKPRGLRLKSDNLRRCCRLQDRGAVQGRSESRWRGIAHRRGGRDTQLARGGIREHDAFLGHEMRGPAGTGRGGVSMAGGRKAKAQGREMG